MRQPIDTHPAPREAIRLAVFDLDGTLVACNSLIAFARFVVRRKPATWRCVPGMVASAALVAFRGDRRRFLKETVLRVINPLQTAEQDTLVAEFVDRLLATKGRRSLTERVQAHARQGDRTVLISASPDLYVVPVGKRLGFEAVLCTRMANRTGGGKCNAIVGPNYRGEEKLRALMQYLGNAPPVDWEASFAYSDDASDLPLLARVGHPLAVHPTRRLHSHARSLGWTIIS